MKAPILRSLPDFLALEIKKARKIIHPILDNGGIMVLHGRGGVGKTPIATALAKAIVDEDSFLDSYDVTGGAVAFIQADMPLVTHQDRWRSAVEVIRNPERVYVAHFENSFDVRLVNPSEPWVQEVRARNPSLVIVDSLRKVHRGNENDNDTPSQVYNAWKELFPDGTFCFLHHDTKERYDPMGNLLDGEGTHRGAAAWTDDADLGIQVRKVKGAIRLKFEKVRSAPPQESIWLDIHPDTILPVLGQHPEDAGRPRNTRARARAYEILQKEPLASNRAIAAILEGEGICGFRTGETAAKEARKEGAP